MKRKKAFWTMAALPLVLAACGSEAAPSQTQSQVPPTSEQSAGVTDGAEADANEGESTPGVAATALELWDQMTERERAASVLMLNYPGTDAYAMAQFVAEIQPAGLILMGDGIPEDEADLPGIISEVQSASSVPLLIAVDQEGGLVRRVSTDPTPGAEDLRDLDPEATLGAFETRARVLQGLGFNTNFGIVADVTDDPDSFIYSRVLGLDPDSSADRVAAAVAGEKTHVLSALKHFPGHGSVAADSHTSLPTTDMTYDQWRTSEAPPFIAGIDAGGEMVMFGHLAYADVDEGPASLSSTWVDILRNDLGFEGVIVTDDMKMLRDNGIAEYSDAGQNAVAALKAGVDLVLDIGSSGVLPEDFANGLIDSILAAVESGELPEETLKSAAIRVLEQRLDQTVSAQDQI